ncbi:hypothetical protein [Nafulsella turpanensis]|uniref:hypothetical protein n=1 Tax=Nafulsella turpanensis TaxID=1265690 RepID=UPI000346B314|nr:hypothetical protein [Nafulsella turpanensis]
MPNDRVPKHKQRLATDQGQDRQLANQSAPAKGTGKESEGKKPAGTKSVGKAEREE